MYLHACLGAMEINCQLANKSILNGTNVMRFVFSMVSMGLCIGCWFEHCTICSQSLLSRWKKNFLLLSLTFYHFDINWSHFVYLFSKNIESFRPIQRFSCIRHHHYWLYETYEIRNKNEEAWRFALTLRKWIDCRVICWRRKKSKEFGKQVHKNI